MNDFYSCSGHLLPLQILFLNDKFRESQIKKYFNIGNPTRYQVSICDSPIKMANIYWASIRYPKISSFRVFLFNYKIPISIFNELLKKAYISRKYLTWHGFIFHNVDVKFFLGKTIFCEAKCSSDGVDCIISE